jgi:Plasmid pRiA4b ORF-3-like protein
MRIKDLQFKTDEEPCLRGQAIGDAEPGSVLRDFRMLLDFVGADGVEAGGIYNLLPIKSIAELDRRLSRPLNLELKRPQLKSHPYLQGLHLLLRASGLGVIQGAGPKARLLVDPAMRVQWNQLNPTEQYFNLLEAWLRFGRSEIVGDPHRTRDEPMLPACVQAWRSIPKIGRKPDIDKPQFVALDGIDRSFYNLALLDLFGLVRVEQPPRPVAPWCPAFIGRLSFGDGIFTLLQSNFFDPFLGIVNRRALHGDDSPVPRLGMWQPLFQPYFPEWQNNLEFSFPEPRDGSLIFRVSLGKIWRLIAISAEATLADLVDLILESVNFDNDHLYRFTYRDRTGVSVNVGGHEAMDDGPCAEEVAIGKLPLELGQSMDLHYDFGDDWHFAVTLERVEPPRAKIKPNRILEKHGKSPEQYPEADWW